jgi:hypothetical protein
MNGHSPFIRLKTVTEKYRCESDFTRIAYFMRLLFKQRSALFLQNIKRALDRE